MSGSGAYPPGCSQWDLDYSQSCQGCGACEECRDDYQDMGRGHGVAGSGDDEKKGVIDMGWDEALKDMDRRDDGAGGVSTFVGLKDGDRIEFACVGEPQRRLNPWGRAQWTINVYDLGAGSVRLYSMPASVFREVVKVRKTTAEHFGGIGCVAIYCTRTGSGKETTKYECGFLRPLSDAEKATIDKIGADQLHEIRDADPFEDSTPAGGANHDALRAAGAKAPPANYSDGDIPF